MSRRAVSILVAMSASLCCVDLELGDLLAELFTSLDVCESPVEGTLRVAEALRRNLDATFVEELEDLVEALALFAEQVGYRHAHILEGDFTGRDHAKAHLVTDVGDLDSRRVSVDRRSSTGPCVAPLDRSGRS